MTLAVFELLQLYYSELLILLEGFLIILESYQNPHPAGGRLMFCDKGRSSNVQAIYYKVSCWVIENVLHETHLGFCFSFSPAVT